MSVFYEVAKTFDQSEPFAVIRIDAAKKLGAGVEGVVVSTHRTQEDADNARMDAVTMVEAAKELERLSALWIAETRENERLSDTLKGLVGLIDLIKARDDIAPELTCILTSHWRIREARAAIAKTYDQAGAFEAQERLIETMVEALEDAREKMWAYGFSENDLQPIRVALSQAEELWNKRPSGKGDGKQH